MKSHGYKQNEISQKLSIGTKIFKTSYYTVLRAFSFKSEKAPNMLTKYKITVTVTPNNILFFNQRFD
jgi:hypothetical protein